MDPEVLRRHLDVAMALQLSYCWRAISFPNEPDKYYRVLRSIKASTDNTIPGTDQPFWDGNFDVATAIAPRYTNEDCPHNLLCEIVAMVVAKGGSRAFEEYLWRFTQHLGIAFNATRFVTTPPVIVVIAALLSLDAVPDHIDHKDLHNLIDGGL